MKTIIAFLTISLLTGLPAFSQSFDCGKARSIIERTICSDWGLKRIDSQLAIAYVKLSRHLGGLDLNRQKKALSNQQKKWRKRRKKCRKSIRCISQFYEARLKVIQANLLDAPTRSPSFDCRRANSNTDFAICLNATLVDLDHRLLSAFRNTGKSDAMRKDQRSWLKKRNKCFGNISCLGRSFQRRIAALESYQIASTTVQPDPVRPTYPLPPTNPVITRVVPQNKKLADIEAKRLKQQLKAQQNYIRRLNADIAKREAAISRKQRDFNNRVLRQNQKKKEALLQRQRNLLLAQEQQLKTRETKIADQQKKWEQQKRIKLAAVQKQDALKQQMKRLEILKSQAPAPLPSSNVTSMPLTNRVAMVVGINKYANLPETAQLKTAVNDAALMAASFKELGFKVIEVAHDVSRPEFIDKWQNFLNAIQPGSTAAFFFAGHGLQMNGVSYLLPSDISHLKAGRVRALQYQALSLNDLLNDLQNRQAQIKLIILDACRNAPFENKTRGLSITQGLARPVEVDGNFVMYSARSGQTALDSLPSDKEENQNSIFTRTLVPLLLTKNISIQQVALRIRQSVSRLANSVGHAQTPAYYDELNSELCLNGACQSYGAQSVRQTTSKAIGEPKIKSIQK